MASADISESMGWTAGLIVDRRFGPTRLYPGGGLSVRTGRSRWRLMWPDPSVSFEFDGPHSVHARIYPDGNRWHVQSKFSDLRSNYEHEAWRAELEWSRTMGPRFDLALGVGIEFDRFHEFDTDQEIRVASEVESAPYAALSITYRWGVPRSQ